MEKLRALTIERLNKLVSPKKQIAFAYSACHRMFPNYQNFCRKHMWGDEYCLIRALEAIRNFILNDLNEFDKAKLLLEIDNNTPNSDNFSDSSSTYAQNAALVVYYTLNNLDRIKIEELSWALVLSRDTVDAYIQEIEDYKYDERFESNILNHWMMKRELEKQEFDFSYLQGQSQIDEGTLEFLTAFNNGKSNIDTK